MNVRYLRHFWWPFLYSINLHNSDFFLSFRCKTCTISLNQNKKENIHSSVANIKNRPLWMLQFYLRLKNAQFPKVCIYFDTISQTETVMWKVSFPKIERKGTRDSTDRYGTSQQCRWIYNAPIFNVSSPAFIVFYVLCMVFRAFLFPKKRHAFNTNSLNIDRQPPLCSDLLIQLGTILYLYGNIK